MTDTNERELHRRFAELRDDEQSRAPGFEQLIERRDPAPMRVRTVRVGVAAGAIVAAVATLLLVSANREVVPVSEIVAWRAPSDVLLTIARPSMFGPLTPLGASVLDAFTR